MASGWTRIHRFVILSRKSARERQKSRDVTRSRSFVCLFVFFLGGYKHNLVTLCDELGTQQCLLESWDVLENIEAFRFNPNTWSNNLVRWSLTLFPRHEKYSPDWIDSVNCAFGSVLLIIFHCKGNLQELKEADGDRQFRALNYHKSETHNKYIYTLDFGLKMVS